MDALALVMNAVIDNDNELLDISLSKFPLERLPVEQSISLLTRLLTVAMEYNKPDVVQTILNNWDGMYENDSSVEFTSLIFTLHSIPIEVLTFVITSLETMSFLEVLDDLSNLPSRDSLIVSCQRVIAAFGSQSASIYKVSYDNAISLENGAVESFLLPLVEATAPYSDVPSWVIVDNIATENDIIRSADVVVEVDPTAISNEEAVELLTDGLANSGINISDIEQSKIAIAAYLRTASLEDKRELLAPIVLQAQSLLQQEDEGLFRIHGPANPLLDSDASQMSAGGCRMLSCMVFDYDDEDHEYVDWFIGNCQTCLNRIRSRAHAIRLPYLYGGWKGCYCSFECLREENSCDVGPTRYMVDNIEARIKRIGIRDRVYDWTLGVDVGSDGSVSNGSYDVELAIISSVVGRDNEEDMKGSNIDVVGNVYTNQIETSSPIVVLPNERSVIKQLPAADGSPFLSAIPGSGLSSDYENIQSSM